MKVERLVAMANDIAAFFASEPAEQAAAGVAGHLTRFWDPRMRRQIVEHHRGGGAGLSSVAAAGVARLAAAADS